MLVRGKQLTPTCTRPPRPSVLSQLRAAPTSSQVELTSNLDPSLEAFDKSKPMSRDTVDSPQMIPPLPRSPSQGNAARERPSNEGYAIKGGYLHGSPPASPRAHQKLPQRPYPARDYQSLGGFGASPPRTQASPLYSFDSKVAPLPHLQQAHYYGAPDIDVGQFRSKQHNSHTLPQDPGHYIFDSVGSGISTSSTVSSDVLAVVSNTNIDFYHVDRKKATAIGNLSDVGGSIVGAKVQCLPSRDPESSIDEWMVILIIHGPYLDESDGKPSDIGHDEFDASKSMVQALQATEPEHLQTRVVVYSLYGGQRLTTLFAGPKVSCNSPENLPSSSHFAPAIIDIQANERFVTLSSGISGETIIFHWTSTSDQSVPVRFHSIGKVWTRKTSARQQNLSASSTGLGQSMGRDDNHMTLVRPILSLGPRWLAFVPPAASSQSSIHGEVPASNGRKVPGLSSHAPPEEPSATCILDTPDEESFINRVARDATQEFVKGARWVGNQGITAWNRYWSQAGENSEHGLPGSSPTDRLPLSSPGHPVFPPTHAQEQQMGSATAGPSSVAILDLEKLVRSQQLRSDMALQPMATFSLRSGCSALSLAPNGVHLFTASARGDKQQVWDLKRLMYSEADRTPISDRQSKAPSVREIARFTRITEAKVVDISWTKPNGAKLALLTDNGTMHVYTLPLTAFYWPPFYRSKRTMSLPDEGPLAPSNDHERGHSETSSNAFTSAFSIFAEKTQPLLSAVRGRTLSASNSLPESGGFTGSAGVGGRSRTAVAANINRSFTAAASGTVNTLRHFGENRIHLPGPSLCYRQGCAQWLDSKDEDVLAVAGQGAVRLYTVGSRTRSKGNGGPSAVATKPFQLELPRPLADQPPAGSGQVNPREALHSLHNLPRKRVSSSGSPDQTHPLSYAEIETHAPYQPFHSDERVQFHVYDEDSVPLDTGGPWIFGEDMAATRLTKRKVTLDKDRSDEGRHPAPGLSTRVGREVEEDGDHITVTTGGMGGHAGMQEGFFEDDLAVVDLAQHRV